MLYGLIFVFSAYIIIFGIILASISYYYTENKFFKGGVLVFLTALDDSLIVENGLLTGTDAALNLVKDIPGEVIAVITNVLRPVVNFAKEASNIVGNIAGGVYSTIGDVTSAVTNNAKNLADDLKNEFENLI